MAAADFGQEHGSLGQLRRTPEDQIGGPVVGDLVLHPSDGIALVIRHISAFPDGFYFLLGLREREPRKNWGDVAGDFIAGTMGRSGQRNGKRPYFAVSLANGSVIDATWRRDAPSLEFLGGHGSEGYAEAQVWCPYLPPRGNVRFLFEWPSRGVERAEAKLDGRALRSAARDARPLWPRNT